MEDHQESSQILLENLDVNQNYGNVYETYIQRPRRNDQIYVQEDYESIPKCNTYRPRYNNSYSKLNKDINYAINLQPIQRKVIPKVYLESKETTCNL